MGDIKRRLARMEHPNGGYLRLAAEHYTFLADCREIRARLDPDDDPPDDDTLRREAEALAATGRTPAQVAMEILVKAWEMENGRHRGEANSGEGA
jgi:hypothetical protein